MADGFLSQNALGVLLQEDGFKILVENGDLLNGSPISFEGGADGADVTTTTEPSFSTSSGTTTNVTHDTVRFVDGSTSALLTGTTSRILAWDPGAHEQTFLSWYVWVQDTPSTNYSVYSIRDSANADDEADWLIVSTALFRIRNDSLVSQHTYSYTTGQWYRADWELGVGDGTQQRIRYYTGDTLHSAVVSDAVSDSGLVAWGGTTMGIIRFGTVSAPAGTNNAWVDYVRGSGTAMPPPLTTFDGTFETVAGTAGWDGQTRDFIYAVGVARSSTFAYAGTYSLKATMPTCNSAEAVVAYPFACTIGERYDFTARVRVPTGVASVAWYDPMFTISSLTYTTLSTGATKDAWVLIDASFVATDAIHYFGFACEASTTAGQVFYVDNVTFDLHVAASGFIGWGIPM